MFPFPKKHQIFGIATVNSKGQFVLPAEARKSCGIKPGDQLLVVSVDELLIGLIKVENIDQAIEHLQAVKSMGEMLPGILRPDSFKQQIHDIGEHIDELKHIQDKNTPQGTKEEDLQNPI